MSAGVESAEPGAESPPPAGLRWIPGGVHYGLCAAFGAFFAISGVTKLMDPIVFRSQILGYEIIGDPYAAMVAIALPWTEIFCGAALIFGVLRMGALAVLNVSLVVFLGAIVSAWRRGLDIECGCFGSGEKGQFALWVIEDTALLALGVFLLVAESLRRQERP